MDTQEFRLAILLDLVTRLEDTGKTSLQKLVYFLQESFDIPTGYGFKMHHYGPYSEALDTDMSRLKFTGYVDIDPDPRGYGYHVKPSDQAKSEWKAAVQPLSGEIDRMVETFGDKQTAKLELLATIHFVDHLLTERSSNATRPPKNKVVDTVHGLKPKFGRAYIDRSYTELKDLGLLR